MRRNVKLFVSDLDGTLIEPTETITPDFEVLNTILKKKGVFAILASGRCLSETQKFLDVLTSVNGVIINNGAGARMNGMSLWNKYFPAECVKETIRKADSLGMTILISNGDDIRGYKLTPYIQNEITCFSRFNRFYIPLEKEWRTEQFQRVSIIDSELPGRVDQLLPLLEPYNREIEICRYDNRHLDIVRKGTTKGSSVLRLAALLNIKADEILAVGDGANDVEMLRSVGIGAAVKNASDAAKKSADIVLNNDGIKGVIEAAEQLL